MPILDEPGRREALIIAASRYEDRTLQQLRAPGHDAADLAEVLRDPAIGDFQVRTLIDEPVEKLTRGIVQLCAAVGPSDLLLLYLSCHGVLDDRGHLYYAAVNTDRPLLAATAVSAKWLREQLDNCRARRQILLLDCCHSGAFAKGAKGDDALALEDRFDSGRGKVVLTASRATEYSFEGTQPVGDGVRSVFTKAVVDGLRSGAADRNKDGLVTVNDLYRHVYDTVRAAESRQTPGLWASGAEGDIVVARNPLAVRPKGGQRSALVTGAARPRFVNPAPLTAPSYFQDRHLETEQIADFVRTDDHRVIAVVGRGGVGKTAMVCRMLKALESGHLPDKLGELSVDGIVYLSPGAHSVNFPNLVTDLCRLLPAETADRLRQRYQDPQQTPAGVMHALLEEFPTGRTVVLLDNFEDLVETDTGTFAVIDPELDEALRAVLSAPAHQVKVIITTRVAPGQLLLTEPGVERLELDEGLPSPYAERLLRARDRQGKLGIRDAPAELLDKARVRTRGFPRALEAFAAILSADRDTTLPELLAQTESLPGNVVEELVGEAFERVDPQAQQVMQALAIYPVPVPKEAVDYLLQPHQPAVAAAPVLGRLVNVQLARRDAGRYSLHQVDRDYALSRIPAGEPAARAADPAPFTRHALRYRAADYFAQVRAPRQDWKSLDHLAPQMVEFELRCQCGDYDTAAGVLLGIDIDFLTLWGHYRLTIDLHQRLQGHLSDPTIKAASTNNLGTCHLRIGQTARAIELYGQALTIYRAIGDPRGEAANLGNLGNRYAALGQIPRSIELHEQALTIHRAIGNPRGEAADLGNLGNRYAALGQIPRSIELHEQALTIYRAIGNPRDEANTLGNLGNRYAALGQIPRSIELYEQALTIHRAIGNLHGEAIVLNSLGDAYVALRLWSQAAGHQQRAIDLADAIGFAQTQSDARLSLAMTLLFSGNPPGAEQAIDAAVKFPYPPTQPAIALVAGIAHLLQHSTTAAAQAFEEALNKGREQLKDTPDNYAALDATALALCGLALTGGGAHATPAAATFHVARAITAAPGIVSQVLRLFDTMDNADPTGAIHHIRAAAAGVDRR